MRKAPSEIETLAEQQIAFTTGIKSMKDNWSPAMDSMLRFQLEGWQKVESRLAELRSAEALHASQLKETTHDAEMTAVTTAWAKQNPGKKQMEFGGDEETQKLYDQFASAPPSAGIRCADLHVCGYCGKSATVKLVTCSQCRSVAYCGKECQKAAWKGHKKVCKQIKEQAGEDNNASTEKRKQLPLTWDQLEAYDCAPAEGKVWNVVVTFALNFLNVTLP
jgi:hypothetical protein